MNGNESVSVNEESLLNPVLLRWHWRRHRWLNLFALILSVGILTVLVLNHQKQLGWSGNMVSLGVIVAGISGLTAVGDTSGAFLLARPASRRQLFNTLVVGNLLPWFLLVAIPTTFAIAVSTGPIAPFNRFLDAPTVFYLNFPLWTLTTYLASVYQGCSYRCHTIGYSFAPGKEAAARPAPSISILWLLLIGLSFAGDRVLAGSRVMAAMSSHGPVLVAAGVISAAWSYHAGWRLFRNLDF